MPAPIMFNTPPPWLAAKVDQFFARLEATIHGAPMPANTLLMAQLNEPDLGREPTPRELREWEHTCDRCGKHLPGMLRAGVTNATRPGVHVETWMLVFGVCESCLQD